MSDRARIGVDVGGTFTDLVTVDGGTLTVGKVASTPEAPERGVLEAIEGAIERDEVDPGAVSFLGHGTTVATNAVLEGEWADTALVTTEGFRDVLEIGRQDRPGIYDFAAEKATPVVERDRRYEVPERLDERGTVVTPLDEAAVRDVADEVRESGVDAVAVCLLHAFENDAHERRVAELLEAAGVTAAISLSSHTLPEVREYERTATTALDAALKPVIDRYVGRLDAAVEELGVRAAVKLMQSNGGVVSAAAARERPVNTLLSGPAAGVRGAAYVAGLAGFDDVVTMDMGGTSCDVSLVRDGDPLIATDVDVDGYPVSVPMVDVHTVGSGGGSIARVDAGGALRVGPESAGADPGPVCYGRGGTRPTVTDAHLVCGRLDPAAFLPGLDVDADRVREAIATHLAAELEGGVEAAARGVLEVANATMERALRVVSVERGYDPREFALVAFGGAGPLHAASLAAAVGIPRVVVPRTAGVLSALGLLISDVVYDYGVSRVRPWSAVEPTTLSEPFDEFAARGRDRLSAEGFDADATVVDRSVDVRYAGQSFELRVPVPDGPVDGGTLSTVAERFHERHRRRYGHAYPAEPVELVTVRTRARGVVDPPELRPEPVAGSVDDAVRERRPVSFGGDPVETVVYEREGLPTGGDFDGPAVIEGAESTIVVPPDQRARVDDYGSVVVEVDA